MEESDWETERQWISPGESSKGRGRQGRRMRETKIQIKHVKSGLFLSIFSAEMKRLNSCTLAWMLARKVSIFSFRFQ